MHSWVDPCLCPDQGSDLRAWCMGTTLLLGPGGNGYFRAPPPLSNFQGSPFPRGEEAPEPRVPMELPAPGATGRLLAQSPPPPPPFRASPSDPRGLCVPTWTLSPSFSGPCCSKHQRRSPHPPAPVSRKFSLCAFTFLVKAWLFLTLPRLPGVRTARGPPQGDPAFTLLSSFLGHEQGWLRGYGVEGRQGKMNTSL